jgi:hypothetical protein
LNQRLRLQGIKIISVVITVVNLAVLVAAYAEPTANTSSTPSSPPNSQSTSPFAGKTIWVVDVNSNEDYNSLLLEAVEKLLPQYAPGVKVKRVRTGEKNPFFLLKEEDYPSAAICGTGVCVGTTPQSINYASSALKLGIPAVIMYVPELKDTREKYVKIYKVPDLRFYEVSDGAPATAEEASLLAKGATPALVNALADQLKK